MSWRRGRGFHGRLTNYYKSPSTRKVTRASAHPCIAKALGGGQQLIMSSGPHPVSLGLIAMDQT